MAPMRFFFPVMLLFNLFYLTALPQSEYYSISPYHLSIIEKALNFAYNEKYSSADSLIDKLEKENLSPLLTAPFTYQSRS